jgi:hypothetical protein
MEEKKEKKRRKKEIISCNHHAPQVYLAICLRLLGVNGGIPKV